MFHQLIGKIAEGEILRRRSEEVFRPTRNKIDSITERTTKNKQKCSRLQLNSWTRVTIYVCSMMYPSMRAMQFSLRFFLSHFHQITKKNFFLAFIKGWDDENLSSPCHFRTMNGIKWSEWVEELYASSSPPPPSSKNIFPRKIIVINLGQRRLKFGAPLKISLFHFGRFMKKAKATTSSSFPEAKEDFGN